MRRKKILAFLLLVTILLMGLSTAPVIAAQNNKNKMLDQMEREMNKAGVETDGVSIMSITPVQMGTNTTFSWANGLNSGWGGSGNGTHGEGAGYANEPGWADSGVYLQWDSQASIGSWAWIGNQISVSGSGTQNVTINFQGSYHGHLFRWGLGVPGVRIRVSVQDLGTYTDLGGNTVYEKTGITVPSLEVSGNINHSVNVALQAGHSYALKIGVATSAETIGGGDSAQSVFSDTNIWGDWTPKAGGDGITYSQISLTWE